MRRIKELFDNPVQYDIYQHSDTEFMASFSVDNIEYDYVVLKRGEEWEIDFEVFEGREKTRNPDKSNHGILGVDKYATVLSTVAALTREFIVDYTPNRFYFLAVEPSRQKVYDIFAKKLTSIFPYEVSTKHPKFSRSSKIYTFTWK